MTTTQRPLLDVRRIYLEPAAAELLWTPQTQQAKRSQTGGRNVRDRTGFKGERVRELLDVIAARTPWLRVRYAF